MSEFRYRAYDRKGQAIEGTMQGESGQTVAAALSKQGFIPISVAPIRGAAKARIRWTRRVRPEELYLFNRQLWTLLKAGLPLQSGLVSLREQTSNETLRRVIEAVIRDIEGGTALSASVAKHPEVFSPLYVSLVRAGEASGKLDEILFHVAEMGEFEVQTRDKIKSATRYPILAFTSLVIAFFMVVTYVIPKFADVFGQYGARLPLATRFLLGLNALLRHHWLELAIGGAAAWFGARALLDRPAIRYRWDLLKLKTPVFGPLFENLAMSRFSRVLAELLASGVPVLQALELVSGTADNAVIARAIEDIRHSVNEGRGMAEPMKSSRFFPPIVVNMVEVGEQTGKTEELLRHVADYYDDKASHMIKNLTTLIEPLFIVVLGGMVIVLALGVFSPMWGLVNVVH
jgi:type II secretory pathway component PulF